MIVPSRLLGDLLEQIDQKRAAHLALDFARHVLDLERDEIEEAVSVACLEYMDAAHEAIGLESAVSRLLEAEERLRAVAQRRTGNRFFLARGADFTMDAARFGAGSMLDRAHGRGPSSHPSCLSVARQLQAEAGRWAARHRDDDVDERTAARRARWEEARWQVRHVIASKQNPHGDA